MIIRLPFGRTGVGAFGRSGTVCLGAGVLLTGSAAVRRSDAAAFPEPSEEEIGEPPGLYPGKKAEPPRSSFPIVPILSRFFIGVIRKIHGSEFRKEHFPDKFIVGESCFCAGIE